MDATTVADTMTRCPLAVRAGAHRDDIAGLLSGSGIGAVPVVDAAGRPIGLVSDVDLVRGGPSSTARELMTGPVPTEAAGEPLASAARLLTAATVRRLCVVDGGRLVGVLSRRDLLRALLPDDEELRQRVEWEVLPGVAGIDTSRVRVAVERGVVLMVGRVEWRSQRLVVERAVRAVPGVVRVRNRLGFHWDDAPRRRRHRRGSAGRQSPRSRRAGSIGG